MKNKIKILTLFVFGTTLMACAPQTTSKLLLSPAGAPTLALYSVFKDKSAETTTQITSIPAQLQNKDSEYKYIVFDSVNGINLQKAGKSHYTYIKMLTSGNFHLVGIGTADSEIKAGEKVLSYGKGLLPDKVLNFLLPEGVEIEYAGNAVSDVASALIAGKTEYKYAFLAQPAVATVMGKVNTSDVLPEKKIYDFGNITPLIKEKTNNEFDYVPQGALFVKNDYYKSNENEVKSFLNLVNSNMKTAKEDVKSMVTTINEIESDITKQATIYGTNVNIIEKLQADGKNQFGIADEEADEKYTIERIDQFQKLIQE